MSFEIVITKPAISVAPEFNFEELEKNVIMLADDYKSIAYTEDMIKDAKKDKAALRKLKENLNSERIRLEKEYMMPFNSFKEKINKLIGIIDEPIKIIDEQVKAAETAVKEEKRTKLMEVVVLAEAPLDGIKIPFDEKWLNTSVSIKKAKEEIAKIAENISSNLELLKGLTEFSFEAVETYKETLDVKSALKEVDRLRELAAKKAKAEEKARLEAEAKAKAEEEAKARLEAEAKIKAETEIEAKTVNAGNNIPAGNNSIPVPPPMTIPTAAPIASPVISQPVIPQTTEVSRNWYSLKVLVSSEEANEIIKFLKERNISYTA